MTFTTAIRRAVAAYNQSGWRNIEIRWRPNLNADNDLTGSEFDARPASVPYSADEELFLVLDDEDIANLTTIISDPWSTPADTDAYLADILEQARREADLLRERGEE